MRTRPALAIAVAAVALLAGCNSPAKTGPAKAGATATQSASSPNVRPTHTRRATYPLPRPDRGQPWRIAAANASGIQGYASRDSIAPGEPLDLYVDTRAPSFTVQVYRMGWYAGTLGHLATTRGPYKGQSQPASRVEGPRRMVTTHWARSAHLDTTGWLPGTYLLRLTTPTGDANFVPLTVRGPSSAGRVVLVSPDTTWQAYNRWGCCSLYDGDSGGFSSRSYAVTFDRPYLAEDGAGEFIDRELPVVAEVERLGIAANYVTDVDLERDPHILDGATAVVSMGHDEYYSKQMRATLTAARDAGSNVAFFGANAIYRRVRFEASATGPDRVMVDYKDGSLDPVSRTDPSMTTADWPASPDPQPESSLTGAMYDCFVRATSDAVVVAPSSYLFGSVHVATGLHLPGLMGPEVDHVSLANPTPRPLEILMHSPFQCPGGVASAADTTYYSAPSGAGVFDSGTMRWVCAIYNGCHTPVFTGEIVRRVTDTLLLAFAQPKAGGTHPAHDNVKAILG